MPKSKLSVVSSVAEAAATPPRLGTAGRRLWRMLTERYDFSDEGSALLLEQAAKAYDRAEELAAIIDKQGATIVTAKGELREHPLLKHETACRALAARSLARLGLHLEPLHDKTSRGPSFA